MAVIETRIDTQSDAYQKNFARMTSLVADLKANLKQAREERSDKARS